MLLIVFKGVLVVSANNIGAENIKIVVVLYIVMDLLFVVLAYTVTFSGTATTLENCLYLSHFGLLDTSLRSSFSSS